MKSSIKNEFEIYKTATSLPKVWDEIAGDNIFIKKDMLIFLEEVNPCDQEYHINKGKNIIFVTYKLKIDILSFKKGNGFKIPLRIVGVPLSVSCQGFVCENDNMDFFIKYINTFPLLLILNTLEKLPLPSSNTLSTYEVDIKSDDIDDYLSSLNSDKRRRLKKAIIKGKKLIIRRFNKDDYNEKHLELYNQVFERSTGRLEKLNLKYFKQMDAELYEIIVGVQTLAFFQIKQIGDQMTFLFCGVDIANNLKYDTYFNLLLYIIDLSIKRNIKKIHLGQTTAYSKTRVGGIEKARYMSVGGYLISKKITQCILDLLGNKQ